MFWLVQQIKGGDSIQSTVKSTVNHMLTDVNYGVCKCICLKHFISFVNVVHSLWPLNTFTEPLHWWMWNSEWILRACSHALLQWMWWWLGGVYLVVLEVTCWMCSCCSQTTLPQQCCWANGSGHHCPAPIHDHGEWVGWGWGWMWVWVWVGVAAWVWAIGGNGGVRVWECVGVSMEVNVSVCRYSRCQL